MRRLLTRVRRDERGFTLIEMLVSVVIFSIIGGLLLTTLVAAQASSKATRRTNALNEEARNAINRMARELREAREIVAVSATNPSLSFTFEVDFDGDGVIEPTNVDAERLQYSYDAGDKQILLTAATQTGTVVTLPILASDVESFQIDYRSKKYQYDANGDGITTWQELDASAAGDRSGTLTAAELVHIDSLVIKFTVLKDDEAQVYRSQVDLRNRA